MRPARHGSPSSPVPHVRVLTGHKPPQTVMPSPPCPPLSTGLAVPRGPHHAQGNRGRWVPQRPTRGLAGRAAPAARVAASPASGRRGRAQPFARSLNREVASPKGPRHSPLRKRQRWEAPGSVLLVKLPGEPSAGATAGQLVPCARSQARSRGSSSRQPERSFIRTLTNIQLLALPGKQNVNALCFGLETQLGTAAQFKTL